MRRARSIAITTDRLASWAVAAQSRMCSSDEDEDDYEDEDEYDSEDDDDADEDQCWPSRAFHREDAFGEPFDAATHRVCELSRPCLIGG